MASTDSPDRTLRIVLIVIAALVLAPMLLMVVAFPLMGMWGGGMMGGYGGGYGMSPGWGFVWPLVWLVVLVGGGLLAYRWLRGDRGDPALRELRMAYAKGELSDEEFEERRARLDEE